MNIYVDTFITFSKIGAFTFGGGYAMIPLIEKEVVERKKWIDKTEFVDIIAIAQSLPGILAVNTAIFIGYKLKKIKGSLIALLATVLPSFIIILTIAVFFTKFKNNPTVINVFKSIRPAVVALIAIPVFSTAKAAKINSKTIIIPIVIIILISLFEISPIYLVILAGLSGLLYGFKSPNRKFKK